MTRPVRNPAALRLLIGWVVVSGLTLGGLGLAGFMPPSPAFNTVGVPAVIALLLQGGAALMAAKRGMEKMGWLILLLPSALFLLTVGAVLILLVASR